MKNRKVRIALLVVACVLMTIILSVGISWLFTIRTDDTLYYTVLASGYETSGPEYTWETSAKASIVPETGSSPEAESLEESEREEAFSDSYIGKITILDVGQSSCCIIQSAGETAVFDAADPEHAQVPVRVLKDLGVTNVCLLLCSHWDADHVGAALGILKNFEVGQFLYADYEADTRTYQSIRSYIEENNPPGGPPKVGDQYRIGDLILTITGPLHYGYEEENSNSISGILSYDGISVVFLGGDTTEESELDILNTGINVDCPIYLVNHHGSSSSSSDAFIKALSPEHSIISCGSGNDYGHPHASVLNRIREAGSDLYRTDIQGDIVFYITEEGIVFEKDPCNDWTPGVYGEMEKEQ